MSGLAKRSFGRAKGWRSARDTSAGGLASTLLFFGSHSYCTFVGMKLMAKLVFILLLGIVVVLLIDGYLSVRREVELFEWNMKRNALLLGHAMKGLVIDSWGSDGGKRALRLIQDANEHERQVSIRWIWLDAAPGTRSAPLASREELTPLVHGKEVCLRTREKQGQGDLTVYVPVAVDASRVGALELTESLSELTAYIRTTRLRTVVLVGLLVVGSGLLAMPLGIHLVGQPLTRLVEKTRRVGTGDLTRPIDLRGGDELAELAVALNAMCEQLEASRDKVHTETAARIAAIEQLRHADRLKTVGRLASGLAHELGTPLNVIAVRAGLIADRSVSDAEVVESGTIIKAQAERITGLVRKLLDFARRSAPQWAVVDLRQVADVAVKLVQAYAKKQGVALAVACPDVPALAQVDAGQIEQVITNLVMNAVQAMPGEGQVAIAIRACQTMPPAGHTGDEGEYLCLSVTDEGTGIVEEHRQHVFEPFFTTKDVGEGTGLGLAIVYGIIAEHDGWIDVTSEVGKGSCFSVYLPKVPDAGANPDCG
jgi:two-component system NtrC family sensor kinase